VNPSPGDTEMVIVVELFDVADMCDARYNMPVLARRAGITIVTNIVYHLAD